eukprot:CCRYP_004170-RA/>CCRYP_004170-RA protein AED:0.14 eAED:-0.07 QI:0/0/0/0.33/1/1/3/0/368
MDLPEDVDVIPDDFEDPRGFYAALGCSRVSAHTEIKASYELEKKIYRQNSLRTHPDKNQGNPDAANKFLQVRERHAERCKRMEETKKHRVEGNESVMDAIARKWGDEGLVTGNHQAFPPCASLINTRLITCFLYAGKFGWRTLIGLHLMFEISTRYEVMGPICTRVRLRVQGANESSTRTENDTNGQPIPSDQPGLRQIEYYPRGESSDYAFALLLGILGILLSKFFLLPYLPYSITQNQHHVFFHCHLTFFVVYIWSKQHPDRNVNLFGVQMAAAYLPFAHLIIGYALNNGQTIPVDMLHGMFVGHLYFYLACVVPKVMRGRVIIVTPLWMVDLCNWLEGRGGLIFGGGGWEGNNPMLVDVDGVIGG